MATKQLPSLQPVQFILEYTTANPRQVTEDGHVIDVVDIVPSALILQAPKTKPVLTLRSIRQLPRGMDVTHEVAHRAYGSITKGSREIRVTLDTSVATQARVDLTKTQQTFFTNYTETRFQIHRRVAPSDQGKHADAPIMADGEQVRGR